MVLLISGGHIDVPKTSTNMASPHQDLQTCVGRFANNSETVRHKDLTLARIVYILVFNNISSS